MAVSMDVLPRFTVAAPNIYDRMIASLTELIAVLDQPGPKFFEDIARQLTPVYFSPEEEALMYGERAA